MKRIILRVGALACIVALCLAAVTGCSNAAQPADSAQQANRTYMSKVNGIMDKLGDDLESFNDAVSRGDVVNMRTQAKNAYSVFDDLSALEPPEDLADVHKMYLDGVDKLRSALDAYIDLYTEVDSGSFDQTTYAKRLEDVQNKYNEGVEQLKKADETAAGK